MGLLTRWDLIKFLTIKNIVYPESVKVFYTNLQYQDSCLLSKVKGIKLVIDLGLFYELIGLTFEGEELPGKGTAPNA